MKKLFLVSLLIVVVVGLILSGCAKPAPSPAPTPAPASPKPLDIGILTPLTGGEAYVGTNLQNAILLAIDDQNKQGGVTIAGEKYVLNPIIRDSKDDVMVGKSVAEEFIFDRGIKVIAGPFIGDAVGAQTVTEKNKVILLATISDLPGLLGPNKPYTFCCVGSALGETIPGAEYIQKFYPELKTVATVQPNVGSAPGWLSATEPILPQYGLEWLGWEQFPPDTKDFMPIITRALAKKPDIVDTAGTAGDMGGICALLIKQLREAGFNGVIWARTVPPIPVMMEVVPDKYRTLIVTNDILLDSPIVSQAYKDMYQRYATKFGEDPIDIAGMMYNPVKAFFEFLNGQDSMDTTVWMQGFDKYHWQGLWGYEAFWVGKPLFGINREVLTGYYVSEWIDGKPETKWQAPIPWDFYVEK